MPFVSEELYQRLPKPNGGANSPPSLCVTPYPQSNEVKIFYSSFSFFVNNYLLYFSLINIVIK
jgi:valyl-tRNA synthetase